MKIKSIKILGSNFRSLRANHLYEFNVSWEKERISTKVFAGLNGSGKSNFLELFTEIFYFLEFCHLPSTTEEQKANINVGFEIEYFRSVNSGMSILNFDQDELSKDILIRVRKPLGVKPEYSYSLNEKEFIRVDGNLKTRHLLPTKLIAYTSGQNELLSNVYYKLKYHYFECFNNEKNKDDNLVDKSRFLFLDQSANYAVFISNMLLSDEVNLKQFKKVLAIKELLSFRVSINMNDYRDKTIYLQEQLKDSLDKFKRCATTWVEKSVGKKNLLILDFKVNNATKNAFKYYFNSPSKLFSAFYELDYLNLHTVQATLRKNVLKQHKSFNFSDEMPQSDPSNLIFRIEQIQIDKVINQDKSIPIYYKGLSDGEHQFNEVIGSVLMMNEPGCLFLMDEPDTHFNPKWRAKMIDLLNHISVTNQDMHEEIKKVRDQEIILTTHSPFVISDSYKQDVYKFSHGVYENPILETYGSSIGFIMEQIFDRDNSISDYSNNEINKIKDSIKSIEDIDRVKNELLRFGESIEKFDAYSYLRAKEKELNQA